MATTCGQWCSTASHRPTCGSRSSPRATRSSHSTKRLPTATPRTTCRHTFPGNGHELRPVASLEQHPRRVRIVHPRTGIAEDVDARLVASVIFSALYSPLTASVVPALVARAEKDDFQGLFALALAGEDAGESMSIGMQLSVLCSEDSSRVAPELAKETSKSASLVRISSAVSRRLRDVAEGHRHTQDDHPVVSDAPVLVLSGEVDPVTPPAWGASVVKHLARGKHIIVPSTGMGSSARPAAIVS